MHRSDVLGLVAVVLALGATAGVPVGVYVAGTSDGEVWLDFCAVLLGTLLALAGTIALVDWRRRRNSSAILTCLVAESLRVAEQAFQEARTNPNGYFPKGETRGEIMELIRTLETFPLEQTPPEAVLVLTSFRFQLANAILNIGEMQADFDQHGAVMAENENWNSNLEMVRQYARQAMAACA